MARSGKYQWRQAAKPGDYPEKNDPVHNRFTDFQNVLD